MWWCTALFHGAQMLFLCSWTCISECSRNLLGWRYIFVCACGHFGPLLRWLGSDVRFPALLPCRASLEVSPLLRLVERMLSLDNHWLRNVRLVGSEFHAGLAVPFFDATEFVTGLRQNGGWHWLLAAEGSCH